MRRLTVLTALWKRPRVTDYVLRYYGRVGAFLSGDFDLQVVAAASPEDPHYAANTKRRPRVTYVAASNDYVSDKFNAAARYVGTLDPQPDAVVVAGSDDLIAPETLRRGMQAMRQGAKTVQLGQVGLYDLETGRGAVVTARTGAGRFLSKHACRAVQWEPWPSGLNNGLDAGSIRKMRGHSKPRRMISNAYSRGFAVVDLKSTDTQMWSWSHVVNARGTRPQIISGPELFKPFPSNIYAEICQQWPPATR